MIAGWIIYCLVVSTLLAGAAAAADAVMTRRGRSARWIWLAAIVLSLAIPTAALLWQQRMPTPIAGAGEARIGDVFDRVRQRERAHAATAFQKIEAHVPRPRAPQLDADRAAALAVIACIMLASLRVAVDSVLLFRERRRWSARVVDGQPVLVSEQLGPAIVGLLEPAIVLPEWAAKLDDDERRLVLTHEREHLRARDGLLASGALLGTLCMPWSPAIWWAFRRLRVAIEVDCDRRVLESFPDVASYGRLLVDVAQRAGDGSSLAITGFSERAGPLVRRIHAMTMRGDARSPRPLGVTHGVACVCTIVATFMVRPPAPPARSLPGYAPAPLIPKGVADSIVTDSIVGGDGFELMPRHLRTIAAARDLPPVFDPDSNPEPLDGLPAAGRCRQWLRDPRTGTRLHLMSSSTHTAGVVQREDTAWTRLSSIGFYQVETPGAYGVVDGRLLRVGCGAVNHRTVEGQRGSSTALSDLESPDDRARKIGAAVRRAIGLKIDAVELYQGRLNVVVTNSHWVDETPDARWAMTEHVWSAAHDAIGNATMPETLAFSVRAQPMGSSTFFYYTSHRK